MMMVKGASCAHQAAPGHGLEKWAWQEVAIIFRQTPQIHNEDDCGCKPSPHTSSTGHHLSVA